MNSHRCDNLGAAKYIGFQGLKIHDSLRISLRYPNSFLYISINPSTCVLTHIKIYKYTHNIYKYIIQYIITPLYLLYMFLNSLHHQMRIFDSFSWAPQLKPNELPGTVQTSGSKWQFNWLSQNMLQVFLEVRKQEQTKRDCCWMAFGLSSFELFRSDC